MANPIGPQHPQKEVKELKEHIRSLGYDTDITIPGIGTVKVGQPGIGAQLFINKVGWARGWIGWLVFVGVALGMVFLDLII